MNAGVQLGDTRKERGSSLVDSGDLCLSTLNCLHALQSERARLQFTTVSKSRRHSKYVFVSRVDLYLEAAACLRVQPAAQGRLRLGSQHGCCCFCFDIRVQRGPHAARWLCPVAPTWLRKGKGPCSLPRTACHVAARRPMRVCGAQPPLATNSWQGGVEPP